MKSLKIATLTFVSILVAAINIHASENPRNINESIKAKVVAFIEHPDMSALDGNRFNAEIEFIVTRQNRIVVLAVYTDNLFFDEYVKEKLNYKKIGIKGVQCLTPYRLNVSFVQPEGVFRS